MSRIFIACTALIEQDGNFLFVMEAKPQAKGKYNLPSGGLELGESITEAAIREAKEETGLGVELQNLIGIYQRPISRESGNSITNFVFYAKATSGELTVSEEHPEVRYLSHEEITSLESQGLLRSPYILAVIQDHLNGKSLPLETIRVFR